MKRTSVLILLIAALLLAAGPSAAQEPQPTKGWLWIPAIDLLTPVENAYLVGGNYNLEALENGVAWLEGTAWVTFDWARIVLAGHTPGGFERIDELAEGDLIYVTDYPHSATVETYEVVLTTTAHVSDISWLMPTPDETLTLLTCLEAGGDTRLIVHAERVH